MSPTASKRRMGVTIVLMLLVAPFLFWGSRRGVDSMFTAPDDWVPEDFAVRRDFDHFGERFHEGDNIIVSWPGCTIDDPRLGRVTEALKNPDDSPEGELCRAYIGRVASGYELVRELTTEPLDLSRQQAVVRLTGSLVGPDGETSAAHVIFNQAGTDEREAAIEAVLDYTARVSDVPRKEIFIVGPPVDASTIDQHSVDSLRTFMLPSSLIVLLLCRICLRSWRFTFLVYSAAVLGQVLCLSLVYFSGYPMNAVLIVMPPLAMVLTVSSGVHLVNYYHDEVARGGQGGAAARAVRNGWVPCVLAAGTTVIGLLSLLVSDVVPIRMFGVFSSASIVVTVVLLFLLLPGAMEKWPVAAPGTMERRKPSFWHGLLDRGLARLANFVCHYRTTVAVLCLLLMVLAGVGLMRMRTSVSVQALFTPESRILRDYRWLEENIGPTVSVEVLLEFAEDCQLDQLQRLQLVNEVQQKIGESPEIGGILSAATFFPEIPEGRSGSKLARRVAMRRQLEMRRQRFIDMHYLDEDEGAQTWRISARVPALTNIDYGKFLQHLRSQASPLLDQEQADHQVQGITAVYTGSMPLAYDTQRALLNDLFVSFLTAMGLITVVMIVVLRNVLAGLTFMIPNVFPTAVLFGLTSWRGVPIDIGSVMTASVALGIAVDDTLHFLTWFRRENVIGVDGPTAVKRTFRHCARAMMQTTLICGMGLLVYSFSWFVPTSRFAWMMLTLLLAALVGDLLLLPALLAGPLGKIFPKRDPEEDEEEPLPSEDAGETAAETRETAPMETHG